LVKGKLIGVDGELRQDRWEQEGQNRSKIEVVANNLQLLGGGGSGTGGGNGFSGGGPAGQSGTPGPSGGGGPPQPYGQSGYQERRSDSYQDRSPPAREPSGGMSSDGFTDDIPF
jgi:single-strand DNA-binding protein